MSRVDKKVFYKAKDQVEVKGKFGFQYIRANINYRTEIPELPSKPRAKPDEKVKDKKVDELQARIKQLKEQRKEKKDKIKTVNQSYDDRIQEIKNNIDLGKKCIEVLYNDLDFVKIEISKANSKIRSGQNKIDECVADIKKLRVQSKPQKRNFNLEEMTLRQLDQERSKIQQRLSTANLSKKDEAELNSLLTKIGRIKADTTRQVEEPSIVDNSSEIQKLNSKIEGHKVSIEKAKTEKKKLISNLQDIEWKIQCIRQDLTIFIEKIKEIAEQEESNEQSKHLYDEAKKTKEQIYELRDQIAAIEKQFEEKVLQYNHQQQKIKWINWATKVQEEKREEWQAEKLERKKQQQRQKEKGIKKKEGDTKQADKTTEGNAVEQKKQERKKFNKNQKEIDNCSFLIDYCKRLYPTNEEKLKVERKQVNIQEQLKKGAWAKEKGVQIIQSKKNKKDEEDQAPRPLKKKDEPKEQETPLVNKFNHDYFVQKFFDNAKVIPPSNVEELDKAVKELEDKLEYYLSHPDEGVESKFEQDKKYISKNFTQADSKNTKSKGGNKKVINTQEFPSLQ